MVKIEGASTDDIPVIKGLAEYIWPVAYKDIISKEQIAYMLDMMYSEEALKYQIEKQQHTFFLAFLNNVPVGFAAFHKKYKMSHAIYRLSKLYVSTEAQRMGIGKKLLDQVIFPIKPLGASILELNVNRANKASAFYEKMGFIITKNEDIAIGNGFFMNDYVMQKSI
ncbi:GNAT family N-acetyltransferase [soil metagenome]